MNFREQTQKQWRAKVLKCFLLHVSICFRGQKRILVTVTALHQVRRGQNPPPHPEYRLAAQQRRWGLCPNPPRHCPCCFHPSNCHISPVAQVVSYCFFKKKVFVGLKLPIKDISSIVLHFPDMDSSKSRPELLVTCLENDKKHHINVQTSHRSPRGETHRRWVRLLKGDTCICCNRVTMGSATKCTGESNRKEAIR